MSIENIEVYAQIHHFYVLEIIKLHFFQMAIRFVCLDLGNFNAWANKYPSFFNEGIFRCFNFFVFVAPQLGWLGPFFFFN